MSDDKKKMFKAFDDTRELVSNARAGDHGRYLIAAAESSTKLTGIDIKKQNLGTNPVSIETFFEASTLHDWQRLQLGCAPLSPHSVVPTVRVASFEGTG
jgi:hypothetical protein